MFEYEGTQFSLQDLKNEAVSRGLELGDFIKKMEKLGMTHGSNATDKGLNLDVSSQQPFGQDQLETDDEIGFFEGIGISFQNKPAEAKGYWYKAQLAMAPYIELMGGPDAARAWLGDFSKESMGKTGFLDPETNNVVSFNNEAYDRDGHDADENKRYYELVKLRQSVPRYEENPVKIIDVASGKNIEDKVSEEAQEKFKQSLENQKNIRKISDSEGFLDAVKSGEVGDAIVHGSDFIAQTAMQAVLARVTGGTSMMGIMYGDAYTTFNDEKSKLLYGENDPDRFKKLIENDEDQIAIPAALGGLGYLMERAGYKGMMKEMAKRSFTGKTAVGLLATGNKEGLTEYGQGLTERLNLNLGKGMDLEDAVIDVSKYMWTEQAWENYFAGLIGGVGVGGGGKAVNAALRYDETSNQFINEKIKTINGLLELKAKTTNKKKRKNLEDLIQIQEVGLKEYLDNNNKISQYLSGRQKKGLIDLLNQKREARKELQDIFNLHKKGILSNTELDASKSEIDSRIERYDDGMLKIKNDANMSLLMQDLDASGSLVKDIKNLEQLVYKTPAEFLAAVKAEYLAQGKTEKEFEQATKNVSIDGIKVGNKLLINAKVAAEKNAFGTGTHEILHGILKSTLQADDGSGNLSLKGESIVKDFVSKLSSKQKKLIEERLKSGNYKFNKDKTEKEFKEYGEEYLNFYAQLSKEGKFSLNAIQKAGQWLSSFYRTNSEFKKLGFENGEQTKAFLDAFVTDSKNGIYRKEFTELAKEGVGMKGTSEFSKDQTSAVNELAEMGWDNKSWKEQGADFAIKEMQSNKMLDGLIRSKYKADIVPDNFVDLVYSELVNHVKNFKPEQNDNLFGWINSQIANKAGNVYNREFKVADEMKGAKDIGKTTKEGEVKVQVAAEKSAEMEAFEEEDLSIQGQAKKAKADKQRYSEYRRKLGFETGSKIYNEVLDNVKKSLMMAYGTTQNITDVQLRAQAIAAKLKKEYANLNSPLFKQIKNFLTYGVADTKVPYGTKDIYISQLRKLREDIVKNTSTADLVQMERNTPEADRIFTNFVKVLTSIEQVQDAVNREQLPPDALNKITKDKKTGKGAFSPSLYNKIMPTETELVSWADQPGINPVTGARQGLKGTRKDGIAMRMVNGLVTDAIMEARQSEEVQSKIAEMDIDPGSVAELGAAIGREVNVKFSKSNAIGDISAAIDGSGSVNVYSQIKFSKSHREAYEKQLTKKRPDLTEEQRKNAVQSVFDFVDGKEIPNHKKSKYEKMAMHYTANGHLILPEDGYKVIEAERIATQKKIDPFSFKNPNELIETFVGEVKGARTNPDKVKTFTNKTELTDGVTIYDVEDSKQGQEDVRKVIDTHFGEKSNPWCLVSRQEELGMEETIDGRENAITFRDGLIDEGYVIDDFSKVEDYGEGEFYRIEFTSKQKGELGQAWQHWKDYNEQGNGHKIAFHNGRLVAFRDGNEMSWWDRNDNPTDAPVVRGKKDKDGFKPVSLVYKNKSEVIHQEKVTGNKKNGTTMRKDLGGNLVFQETKKNGKTDGLNIEVDNKHKRSNNYKFKRTQNFKEGNRLNFKEERTYTIPIATEAISFGRNEIRVNNITKYERSFTEKDWVEMAETVTIEGTVNQRYFEEFQDPSKLLGFEKANIKYLTPAYERYYGIQGKKVKIVKTTKRVETWSDTKIPRLIGKTEDVTVTINGVKQEIITRFSKSDVKFSLTSRRESILLPSYVNKKIKELKEKENITAPENQVLDILEVVQDLYDMQAVEVYNTLVEQFPSIFNNLQESDFKNQKSFIAALERNNQTQMKVNGYITSKKVLQKQTENLSIEKGVELIAEYLTNVGRDVRSALIVKTNKGLKIDLIDTLQNGRFKKYFKAEETFKGSGKYKIVYAKDGKNFENVEIYESVENIKNNIRKDKSLVKTVNEQAEKSQEYRLKTLDPKNKDLTLGDKLDFIELTNTGTKGSGRKAAKIDVTVTDKSGLIAEELVLEHEITIKNMKSYERAYAKGDISKEQMREVYQQNKVHVLPKSYKSIFKKLDVKTGKIKPLSKGALILKKIGIKQGVDDILALTGKASQRQGMGYESINELSLYFESLFNNGLINKMPESLQDSFNRKSNSFKNAVRFSRSANNPTKGITVLDFDDTLATTKSMIRFTRPDGTKGRLNAEQYASTYQELSELGYKWDFSEFNKVVDGKTAPLFNKAMKLQGKFGPESMFVLTARPAESAAAIHAFLKANGLNIPLKNITGLANSTAEAKALWMADKVGEGYNDFYFADDALQNVQAVDNMLKQFDVKRKIQQAKVSFSKSSFKKTMGSPEYKRFKNSIEGRVMYHGGAEAINNIHENNAVWFYLDNVEGTELHGDGKIFSVETSSVRDMVIIPDPNDNDVMPEFVVHAKDKFSFLKTEPVANETSIENTLTGEVSNFWLLHNILKHPKADVLINEWISYSSKNSKEVYDKQGNAWRGQPVVVLGVIPKNKIQDITPKAQQARVKFSKSEYNTNKDPYSFVNFKTVPKEIVNSKSYKKWIKSLEGIKLFHGTTTDPNKISELGTNHSLNWFIVGGNDNQRALNLTKDIEREFDGEPENSVLSIDASELAGRILPDADFIGPSDDMSISKDKTFQNKIKALEDKYKTTARVQPMIRKPEMYAEFLDIITEHNPMSGYSQVLFDKNGKLNVNSAVVIVGGLKPNQLKVESISDPTTAIAPKFSKSSLRGNKAINNLLSQVDVKSKVQQARVKFSKNMNTEFNKVLERTTGVDANEIISGARAAKRGASKGKYKFFVPPSADDFKGLLYYFVGKGKQGEKDMAFLKKALTDPLNRAYTEFNAARQSIANDYRNLKKQMPDVKNKLLQKTPDGDFTYGDAVRVYLWNKAGFDVPGLNQKDVDNLVEMVTSDPQLMMFAYKLGKISKRPEGYTNPTEHWQIGDIRNDLADATGRVGRKEFFAEFIENVEKIFGKMVNGKLTGDNINKIEAIYGSNFREALEDILYATYTGSSRPYGSNRMVNGFTNWINGSVGATMFVNMRSALLQQMSSVNFLNWGDNNIFKAGKAFANFPQYIKDWAMIFNSDKLKQRRSGLSMDINANELATYLGKSKSKPAALLSWLLQKGFLPTQISDSIAIANGGAGFYRNRVNTYLKQGFKQKEAEEKAWNDFSEIAEETQQSARPDMVSQQQRSPIGKWFLNFLNTPMQYSRIMKKAMLDLVNRRGDAKTHISRIIYYGAAQNAIFYTLQTGLFAAMFDDDDEEAQKFFDTKAQMTANSMVDGLLKGLGFGGAAISTVKNMIIKFIEEDRKGYKGKPAKKVTLEMVNFSPVVGIKVRKISSAIDRYSWDKDIIKHMETFDIDNPIWGISTGIVEGATNVPLNRLYRKVQNVRAAADADREAWQRLALVSGWSVWNIGEQNEELEKLKDEIKARKKKNKKKSKSNVKTYKVKKYKVK